jgi:hypothetical protein
MRHILIFIQLNPGSGNCCYRLQFREISKQIVKSLTQIHTRIKKALEGKPQEH